MYGVSPTEANRRCKPSYSAATCNTLLCGARRRPNSPRWATQTSSALPDSQSAARPASFQLNVVRLNFDQLAKAAESGGSGAAEKSPKTGITPSHYIRLFIQGRWLGAPSGLQTPSHVQSPLKSRLVAMEPRCTVHWTSSSAVTQPMRLFPLPAPTPSRCTTRPHTMPCSSGWHSWRPLHRARRRGWMRLVQPVRAVHGSRRRTRWAWAAVRRPRKPRCAGCAG